MPLPFSHFTDAAVESDISVYRRLLDSKGGVLGDGVISEAEAVNRLRLFVSAWYSCAGRRDFCLLPAAYQVGNALKFHSFFGVEGTLHNGPAWTANGIQFTRASQQYGQILNPCQGDSIQTPSLFFIGSFSAIGTDGSGRQQLFGAKATIPGPYGLNLHVATWGSGTHVYQDWCRPVNYDYIYPLTLGTVPATGWNAIRVALRGDNKTDVSRNQANGNFTNFVTGDAAINSSTYFRIGAHMEALASYYLEGTASFVAAIPKYISHADWMKVLSAYKAGVGIGQPLA